jgi:hypothetical protein
VFDYIKSKGTATRLLKQFGRKIVVEQITTGTYDPETSTVPTTKVDLTPYCCDFDVKAEEYDNLIRVGDRKAYIDASAAMEMNNIVVIDSVRWSIVRLVKLAPAGELVLNIAYIRK